MPMLPRWLHEGLITICGLVALISPVVLWTAWSTTMFRAVLVVGLAAILMIYLLVELTPDDNR
jgi:peptidoglycan/LPS O-acetylase OafA/YrhL